MPSPGRRRALSRLALLGLLTALAAGACVGPLAGAPTPVAAATDSLTQTRPVADFTSVTVDGGLNLVLGTGSATSVEVEAPSNVQPLISTVVTGSDLEVSVTAPGFTSTKPVTVRVSAPTVTSITLSGGATGTVEVMGEALAVSVAGGSVLRGIGTVTKLTVTALGGSDAQLGDLAAQTAGLSLAGGAKTTIRATKQVTGTADGGSVVTLVIAPQATSITTTGGSRVEGP